MQTLLWNICATEQFNSEKLISDILANSQENKMEGMPQLMAPVLYKTYKEDNKCNIFTDL